jgi:hypothetical protein
VEGLAGPECEEWLDRWSHAYILVSVTITVQGFLWISIGFG